MERLAGKDIIEYISKEAGITNIQAHEALRAFQSFIKDNVKAGNTVTIKKFGRFKTGERLYAGEKKYRIQFTPSYRECKKIWPDQNLE